MDFNSGSLEEEPVNCCPGAEQSRWASKHIHPDVNGARIAKLDERTYRRLLWEHRPLTDFWRVAPVHPQ